MGGGESKGAESVSVKSDTGKAQDNQSSAGLPGGDGGADKKLKPCCACPETKQARDKCIVEKGEAECTALIEAHKECLRKNGFKV